MKKKKIIFKEIDLSIKPEKFEEMISKSNGARTVAGILVDFSFKFGFSIFVFLLGLTYAGIYWIRHGSKPP